MWMTFVVENLKNFQQTGSNKGNLASGYFSRPSPTVKYG